MMSDSSSICLSCGLCCDGTLIGFVQLDREELPRVREIMAIEEAVGQGFFVHPCSQLCGTSCQVYADRPKQCAAFQCGLLKKVGTSEQDKASAISSIEAVKVLRAELNALMDEMDLQLQSKSFYFALLECEKKLKKTALTKESNAQVELFFERLKEFEDLISKDFDLAL
jgi:Fe-S-cluster containining protein